MLLRSQREHADAGRVKRAGWVGRLFSPMQHLSESDLLRAELKALRDKLRQAAATIRDYQVQSAKLQQVVAVLVHRAGGGTTITDAELVVVRDHCGCRFKIEPTVVEQAGNGPCGPAQAIELMPLTPAEADELRRALAAEAPAARPAGPRLVT